LEERVDWSEGEFFMVPSFRANLFVKCPILQLYKRIGPAFRAPLAERLGFFQGTLRTANTDAMNYITGNRRNELRNPHCRGALYNENLMEPDSSICLGRSIVAHEDRGYS